MKILIYGLNYHPELIGVGKYTGEMAEWLAKKGHDVKVVTAPPYYPEWKIGNGYSSLCYEKENRNRVAVFRCPLYVPSKPTGIKRIIHLLSFSFSSFFVVWPFAFWRPDVVINVIPTLFSTFNALFSSFLCRAKTWLHIQDYESDAAFHLGILSNSGLQSFVTCVERWAFRKFDRISTISIAMLTKLHQKGIEKKTCLLPNWVDTSAIYPMNGPTPIRDQFKIGSGELVALYAGNMSEKQGLEVVVKAARKLRSNKKIKFILCGEGPIKSKLMSLSSDLTNVQFFPLQPIEQLNQLLSLADIHLLPQKPEAADLVMPSKLTGMLASGKPVVAIADPGTEIEKTVKNFGIVVRSGEPEDFLRAIAHLAEHPKKRRMFGSNARTYAVDHLDKNTILSQLDKRLCEFIC